MTRSKCMHGQFLRLRRRRFKSFFVMNYGNGVYIGWQTRRMISSVALALKMTGSAKAFGAMVLSLLTQ